MQQIHQLQYYDFCSYDLHYVLVNVQAARRYRIIFSLLRNATFIDFRSREHITFSQVEYFVERYCICFCNFLSKVLVNFYYIVPFQSPRELDKLSKELVEYQLMQDEDIPQEVWKEAAIT